MHNHHHQTFRMKTGDTLTVTQSGETSKTKDPADEGNEQIVHRVRFFDLPTAV